MREASMFQARLKWGIFAIVLLTGALRVDAGEKYAFLVGVSRYDEKELKPLRYARQDIIEFRNVLLESGFRPENIILMVDDLQALPESTPPGRFLPESARIRRELQLLLPALEADDSLVIALSGHGVQFKGETEPYFCPLDASLGDRSTLLSLTWLYEQLRFDEQTRTGCRARQRLLLVDACRNDPASSIRRNSAEGQKLESASLPQLVPAPAGVVALFSCAEGQEALEHEPLGHGVFFYHVLEAFRGSADSDADQSLTLDELISFTKSKTQSYARVNLSAPQTPRQKGYLDGVWTLRTIRWKMTTNSLGMKLVQIPAGEFRMGSTAGDLDKVRQFDPEFRREFGASEQPDRRVRLSRAFHLGMHEVTRGQFATFIKATGHTTDAEKDPQGGWGIDRNGKWVQQPEFNWRNPGFAQTDVHPVVNVSWNDATAFCAWLGRKEGRKYRLPTEAEWEYACRGRTGTLFQTGDDPEALTAVANVADGSTRARFPSFRPVRADDGFVFTAPVGRFRANDFGLHDMHGNVAEWCSDWYGDSYTATVTKDPVGPATGSSRVVRGGSWVDGARHCRSAARNQANPSGRDNDRGFRVVLVAE
jgi:formylglycine-generating enzyme